MSGCEQLSVRIPTYPTGGDVCQRQGADGTEVYHNSHNVEQLQQQHLHRYEAEFNRIMSSCGNSIDVKHQKIAELLNGLLANIRGNYENFNEDLEQLEARLRNEKRHLEDQENVLKSNEDSELVTKYRNESSDNRTKKMNTQFTIFITMIVVFLIIEGIVFFV